MTDLLHPRSAARLFEKRARRPYRVCGRCIMDTSDAEIEFDPAGVCNHCRKYDEAVAREVVRGEAGLRKLEQHAAEIRRAGRGKRYDCVLGLSGGVDSSFVAYLTKKKLGLRPLAIHMDNGWNSEVAVRNIENIVKILDLDLYTEVLDWEEFRRLQLAFLRAGTPDSEIPTDHAIVSTLLRQAEKHGVRWIMDGSNLVTELMVPETWSAGHADWRYILHLNERFGGAPLRSYPHYTYFDARIWYPRVRRIRRFFPLNYVDYNKLEAMRIMRDELGWEYYGGKHYESIYTRFYQGYMLPKRFDFDKRRPHLSCLVNAGLMTRQAALEEMDKPAIPPAQLAEDRAFCLKKLGIDEPEFERIMSAELKTFWDYPSYERDARTRLALRATDLVAYGVPAALRFARRLPQRIGAAPARVRRSLKRTREERGTWTG
jgi:N-acetyl sugar amidotransferase